MLALCCEGHSAADHNADEPMIFQEQPPSSSSTSGCFSPGGNVTCKYQHIFKGEGTETGYNPCYFECFIFCVHTNYKNQVEHTILPPS